MDPSEPGHQTTAWFRGNQPLERAERHRDLFGGTVIAHEWKVDPMTEPVRIYGVVQASYFDHVATTPFVHRLRQTHACITNMRRPIKTDGLACDVLQLSECPCAFAHTIQSDDCPGHFKIDVDAHKLGHSEHVYDSFLSKALPDLASALKNAYRALSGDETDPDISFHASSNPRRVFKPSFRVFFGMNLQPFHRLQDMKVFWMRTKKLLSNHPLLTDPVLDVSFSPRKTDRMLGCSKWAKTVEEARVLQIQPLGISDRGARELAERDRCVYIRRYSNLDAAQQARGLRLTAQHAFKHGPTCSLPCETNQSREALLVKETLRACKLLPTNTDLVEKWGPQGSVYLPTTPLCLFRSADRSADRRPQAVDGGHLRFFRPSRIIRKQHASNKTYFSLMGNRIFHRCFSTGCCPDGKSALVAMIPICPNRERL